MTNFTHSVDSDFFVQNRKLAIEIRRRVDQLSAINTVAAVVSQSLDLNITLQTALDAVLSVIEVEAGGISLVDEHAGELVMRAQRGWKQDFVTTPMRIKLGHGMSGHVIRTGEVVVSGDVSKDSRLVVPAVAEENIQAMAMAPMHARGKIIGILSVISYQPYNFDEQEISVLRAIADQVGVALDNARLYEGMREQQGRLMTILQSTADAIIATDKQESVSLLNEAAELLFGLRGDEVIGKPLRDLALPQHVHEELVKAMAPIPLESARPAGSLARTFDTALDNGIFVTASVSPVTTLSRIDDRQQTGWVIVFQDITHIKEAERARNQFIQTAAHDLRNPLGVTLSALTMLNKNWKDPTPTDLEVFGIAMRGVNRMQDLIDDLLNLEKLESGIDLHIAPLNVGELIERSIEDIRPGLQRRNQALHLQIAPALPSINGDARWLARALANLLSNALKYTPEGGNITLHAFADETELTLAVRDDGPGIPYEAQSRLFERFYRVPQLEDKAHGTGLGLAIVKSVVDRHQGRVTVASQPGQGSTFSLIFPLSVRLLGQ